MCKKISVLLLFTVVCTIGQNSDTGLLVSTNNGEQEATWIGQKFATWEPDVYGTAAITKLIGRQSVLEQFLGVNQELNAWQSWVDYIKYKNSYIVHTQVTLGRKYQYNLTMGTTFYQMLGQYNTMPVVLQIAHNIGHPLNAVVTMWWELPSAIVPALPNTYYTTNNSERQFLDTVSFMLYTADTCSADKPILLAGIEDMVKGTLPALCIILPNGYSMLISGYVEDNPYKVTIDPLSSSLLLATRAVQSSIDNCQADDIVQLAVAGGPPAICGYSHLGSVSSCIVPDTAECSTIENKLDILILYAKMRDDAVIPPLFSPIAVNTDGILTYIDKDNVPVSKDWTGPLSRAAYWDPSGAKTYAVAQCLKTWYNFTNINSGALDPTDINTASYFMNTFGAQNMTYNPSKKGKLCVLAPNRRFGINTTPTDRSNDCLNSPSWAEQVYNCNDSLPNINTWPTPEGEINSQASNTASLYLSNFPTSTNTLSAVLIAAFGAWVATGTLANKTGNFILTAVMAAVLYWNRSKWFNILAIFVSITITFGISFTAMLPLIKFLEQENQLPTEFNTIGVIGGTYTADAAQRSMRGITIWTAEVSMTSSDKELIIICITINVLLAVLLTAISTFGVIKTVARIQKFPEVLILCSSWSSMRQLINTWNVTMEHHNIT